MTPISKVPTELLDKDPSSNEELLILQKELEALHSKRRPFIGIGQQKVYLDEKEEYYHNLTEDQIHIWRIFGGEYPPTSISRWPWTQSIDVTEDLNHD